MKLLDLTVTVYANDGLEEVEVLEQDKNILMEYLFSIVPNKILDGYTQSEECYVSTCGIFYYINWELN